jgi:ADP-ribosylglycohydrolase
MRALEEGSLKAGSHEQAVVGSALWAAAGDCLGWITELTDEKGLRYRANEDFITAPTAWRRKIGGRFGPVVPLPAGTYSDDTQLRLAVCRATRESGVFDVEVFAKVEMPVWPAYALGAGKGTMAAAANLSKSSVTWFSNFHGTRERGYFNAGGNGAAMRIQPHVWKHKGSHEFPLIVEVLRDAIVSHGHPHGFGGAVFHAMCVAHALKHRSIPGPKVWMDLVHSLGQIVDAVHSDNELSLFWVGAWESESQVQLRSAIASLIEESVSLLAAIEDVVRSERRSAYSRVLEITGGYAEETRGSGIRTSLAALALSWLFRERSNQEALVTSANALHSDTDTIGTMAGAILGAARPEPMDWPIQDRDYIEMEARRMASIAVGDPVPTFGYPDLLHWQPPTNQVDAVGYFDGDLAVAGLGPVSQIGEAWSAGDSQWQWLSLPFGQTILAKRRLKPRKISRHELPVHSASSADVRAVDERRERTQSQTTLPLLQDTSQELEGTKDRAAHLARREAIDLDGLTDWVIRSDFDPGIIGRAFSLCANPEDPTSLDKIIAFASITGKAMLTRKRRNGQKR